MSKLIVVSNRVARPGGGSGSEGGLSVGVNAAMKERGGVWFGWNGKIENKNTNELNSYESGNINYVTVGLSKSEYNDYYKGYANSVLWPAFHHRPELMDYHESDLQGYLKVNIKFANLLRPLIDDDDVIWIHDYHLIPLGEILRKMGVNNPIGFFLHTPFPPQDLLRAIPGYKKILEALMEYDLVGFHTETDRRCFTGGVMHGLDGRELNMGRLSTGRAQTRSGVYPIGIETDNVSEMSGKGKRSTEYTRLRDSLSDRKLIIGVDRLDYSKGLMHRFKAFEGLLKNYPEFLRKVVYLQISPTSRGDVEAYHELAEQIDRLAGHIIGTYADFDWMPIRYINRGFRRATVFAMYQLARVGFVTPLRDGMNLVAKEYLAAQNPEDPGVLVLSKMAGAAAELDAALIVNPYDSQNVSKVLKQALKMPLDERIDRWQHCMEILKRNNIYAWQENFMTDLLAEAQR
ncbi:Trehalose-6-phosphate synthase [Thalassocella blandensis]|nr:Trehalose-6-phosphate synthase [Thalassocella blandensis]